MIDANIKDAVLEMMVTDDSTLVPILYSLWNSGSFWIHALAIVLVIQILRAIYKTGRKCIQLCAFIVRIFFMERYRVLRLRLFGLLLLALFMTMIIWACSTFIF